MKQYGIAREIFHRLSHQSPDVVISPPEEQPDAVNEDESSAVSETQGCLCYLENCMYNKAKEE